MRLPRFGNVRSPTRREFVPARGINYTENITDGDLALCENLSARRWPCLASRPRRVQQTGPNRVYALYEWNGRVEIRVETEGELQEDKTYLYYRGVKIGELDEYYEPGKRQFAAVNTKLVIWPDKVYLDLSDPEHPKIVDMGVELEASSFTFNRGTTETLQENGYTAVSTWSTVQVSIIQKPGGNITLLDVLKIGDGIELSGITGTYAENNRAVIIKDLTADTITIQGNPFKTAVDASGNPVATTVTADPGSPFNLVRPIPELDFICESGNRLWGCSNDTRTIYSSVLGDPTNFFVYDGLSTDGYALPVATDGDFTGCCRLSSSLLFWKEKRLHKIIGDYPAEYVMYTYEMEGLRAGCHKSMQILNDVLFYVGLHGVFTYAGGNPSDISRAFGDRVLTEAAAGNDGERYFLSCKENGEKAFYVYSAAEGIWLREDKTLCRDFIREGTEVAFLKEDGSIWKTEGDPDTDAGETAEEEIDWSLTFTPFREAVEGRKRYSRLLIRAEVPLGAWLEAKVSCDGGRTESVGRIVGKDEDVSQLWIRPNRCDKFEVTLRGHGPCVIRNVMREFTVGGAM